MESLAFFVMLYLPTAVLLFACGAKNLSLYAFSPLLTLAILGLATLMSPIFGWGTPLLLALYGALSVCAALLRIRKESFECFAGKLREQYRILLKSFRENAPAFGFCLAGIAINAFVFCMIVIPTAQHPSVLVQSYDNPFHLSVIRHIVETGNASPVGAGSVAGAENSIYPDLWHSLVALCVAAFGDSMQENVWVVVMCLIVLVAPIGMCLLARCLFPAIESPAKYLFASLGCMVLPRSFFSFVTFGSLYPNLAGLSLLPYAIAVCTMVTRDRIALRGNLVRFIGVLLVSIIALGLLHPNIAIIFMLFMVPMLVSKSSRIATKIIVSIAALAAWGMMFASPLFSRTVNCLDRVQYSSEMGMRIFDRLPIGYSVLGSLDLFPLIVVMLFVVIGAAIAFAFSERWRNSWYIFSLFCILAIFFASLFPENWFSIFISGFWYRDSTRLMVFFISMVIPLLAILPCLLAKAVSDRSIRKGAIRDMALPRKENRRGSASSIVATLLSLLLCIPIGVIAIRHDSQNLSACTTNIEYATDPFALTSEGARFLEEVSEIVGDSVVLNSDIDQSTWLYPEYGVNALMKAHPANYMASMPESTAELVESIADYGENTPSGHAIREVMNALDVEYVVQASGYGAQTVSYVGNDVVYAYCDSIALITEDTPGFELMFESNGMRLFRILEV